MTYACCSYDRHTKGEVAKYSVVMMCAVARNHYGSHKKYQDTLAERKVVPKMTNLTTEHINKYVRNLYFRFTE